jgi:AcrR family transcriptional regulator
LVAAREVFVEQGAHAPLDEIARRARVGIATLYRRFPDRQVLMRGVALDVLGKIGAEARQALVEEPGAFEALARYMHRALDLRIAAVMPALVGHISMEGDPDLRQARDSAIEPVQRMIEGARRDGTLRLDVEFGDIGLVLIRLSRSLPDPFPRPLDDSLAHRHLDLLIDGLRRVPHPSTPTLSGPAMTLDDLRSLGPRPARPAQET